MQKTLKLIIILALMGLQAALLVHCSSGQSTDATTDGGTQYSNSNFTSNQTSANMEENKVDKNAYLPKIKNGTWYGRMMAFDKSGHIKEGCVCECKFYNDSLQLLGYKEEKILFSHSQDVKLEPSFVTHYENQELIVLLTEPVKDTTANDYSYGPMVLNGKWKGKIIDVDEMGNIHPKFDCFCELQNETLLNLKFKKKDLVFDPPKEVKVEIIFEFSYAELKYNIELKTRDIAFYEKERQTHFQYSENPNCSKCGKPKESTASEYCNSCSAKIKNTCPKCGKQEADAAIYWCTKCRNLKCPHCGINVRSSQFAKYCSDCERKDSR